MWISSANGLDGTYIGAEPESLESNPFDWTFSDSWDIVLDFNLTNFQATIQGSVGMQEITNFQVDLLGNTVASFAQYCTQDYNNQGGYCSAEPTDAVSYFQSTVF